MGVGSVATRLLADFGAEVIKIEDRTRTRHAAPAADLQGRGRAPTARKSPTPIPNKGGLFNNYSRNKLGVTINMRTPEGRDLAERLIAASSAW